MDNVLKKIFASLIAASLLVILIPGCSAPTGNSTEFGDRVGNKAYDFTLKDLNGNTVTLSKLLGQPVMINFWSTT